VPPVAWAAVGGNRYTTVEERRRVGEICESECAVCGGRDAQERRLEWVLLEIVHCGQSHPVDV